jgi:hypothetical protein
MVRLLRRQRRAVASSAKVLGLDTLHRHIQSDTTN